MSEEQFEAILQAIADLQVTFDSLDTRTERMEHRLEGDEDPQPPEWVEGR
jgi:hypothetical protein